MADPRFLNPITILADIGGLSIDVITKRVENYENIITQNPIEDGSPTTDHITNLPPKITLSGGFSDVRISNLLGTAFNPTNAFKGLAKTSFDTLLELYALKETFDVMDGLHLFKDMQFKNIQEIKDREGFSVFFQAEIWGIRKVNIGNNLVTIGGQLDSLNRQKVAAALNVQVGVVSTNDAVLSGLGILA